MKYLLLWVLSIVSVLYVVACAWLYFRQETLLFYPRKLPATYQFRLPGRYAELPIITLDGVRLSGLLFKADAPKGLVFFLHGNAGSLAEWGQLAATYTRLGYDVFMLDYRGYGKSTGTITSQAQLLADVEVSYQQVVANHDESQVVIAGYSLGTGPATWLAARHRSRRLLLHAPYYSLADMAAHTIPVWPILPGFLLRYPMPTNEFIRQVSAPIVLVHGDHYELIPYNSSVRLKALLKPGDQLLTIRGGGHNGLTATPQYQQALPNIL
ncbi:alpha/beta fold hydrolase [Hymenobacter sp. H14-R3]|uniref:alpha/beta hydrolase n=1 Tax=Hymenobacter sp. H14-R3 TaxID=3046308 RepID=UPI0024B8DB08|nr:alpha/beta fold hydrolase [Hymenobacter sp. H14-R3]MDJ0365291.1 alpha/beta fold hydrolase [Hymenobacter sp. H14-R3]